MADTSQTLLIGQACDFPLNGQGYYRYQEPSRQMARIEGISAIDCDPWHPLFPALAETADVLVLQQYNPEWVSLVHERRARGQVTVVEVSDYYFDFQPWHASARAWSDQFCRDELIRLVAAADGVQTTTEPLAEHLRKWNAQVRVFPNHLPEIPDLSVLPDRPLVIGWAGSGSHLSDWRVAAPFVANWVKKTPNVKLHVMCEQAASGMVQLPADRYQFTPSGSLGEYLLFLRGLDVGLAPLLPGEFNRCRSDLKYLEYSVSGVVGIYQQYQPFSSSVVHGTTGFLFSSVDEMIAQLDTVSRNRDLRLNVRKNAHAAVSEGRRLADHAHCRTDFYKELLSSGRMAARIPAEWEKGSLKDGRYWQWRPGRVERAIGALKNQQGNIGAMRELARLSAQYPDHVQARIHLAAHWLEIGNADQADATISPALQRQPRNSSVLIVAAATREALGDAAGAVSLLIRATLVDSGLVRVWSRLLSLLAQLPSDEANRLAYKALDLFPFNRAIQADAHRVLLAGPASSLDRIRQLLELWSTAPDEGLRTHWVLALGRLCETLLSHHASKPELIPCLEFAHAVAPESIRIASCLARALDASGRNNESARIHTHIASKAEEVELWRTEYPQDDLSLLASRIAADGEKRRVSWK